MNISDTMKAIVGLAKATMNLELQEKIVEFREQVMDLQEENLELREENQQLRKEIETYTKGDICPKCKKPTWSLDGSYREAGDLVRRFKCSSCGYKEARNVFER